MNPYFLSLVRFLFRYIYFHSHVEVLIQDFSKILSRRIYSNSIRAKQHYKSPSLLKKTVFYTTSCIAVSSQHRFIRQNSKILHIYQTMSPSIFNRFENPDTLYRINRFISPFRLPSSASLRLGHQICLYCHMSTVSGPLVLPTSGRAVKINFDA